MVSVLLITCVYSIKEIVGSGLHLGDVDKPSQEDRCFNPDQTGTEDT